MRVLAPIAALLLSVAILLTGNGLQGVLLPVRGSLEEFGQLAIGLVASSYFSGFMAGCMLGARLVKRVGHIRAFTAMTAVASTAALAHGLLVDPLAWWILRAFSGFAFAVLFLVIESWLNERATTETRGTVLSAYMVINLTVVTLGQMLLPLHDPMQLVLFAVVSMLISLAAIPVALTGATQPAPIASTSIDLRKLYSVSPVGVFGCLAVGLANGSFWALAPLFAESQGLQEAGIALFMSATVMGGALGQWPLGHLSDRMDRRKIILITAALGTVMALAIVLRPVGTDTTLMIIAAAWGALAFPLYSLSVAHANDYAQAEDFVEVSGGLLLLFAAGAVAGPILASALTSVAGVSNLYLFPAMAHLSLFVFVAHRMLVREAAPVEAHVPFIDALGAAQTVSPCFDEETQSISEEQP